MKSLLAIGASVALVSQSALAAETAPAAERLELAPSSNWVINYDAESCALQRDFGEDGSKVFLELRSFAPDNAKSWQIMVASKDFALGEETMKFAIEPSQTEPVDTTSYDVKLGEAYNGRIFDTSFGNNEETEKLYAAFLASSPDLTEDERALAIRGTTLDFSRRADILFAGRDDFHDALNKAQKLFRDTEEYQSAIRNLETSVKGIALIDAFSRDVLLQTGELSKPIQALEVCLEELATHWGVDVEAHKSLTRNARPNDRKWMASKVVYPSKMVKAELGEKLRLRLDISAEGKVTGCHLQMSMSDEEFRNTACKQFSKVKFLPALDANGQPIDSYYRQVITYRMVG